jgi:hypothetical protein
MLSVHLRLGLPSGFFSSGFPTSYLYTFLFSPIRATCTAHLILLDFIMGATDTCWRNLVLTFVDRGVWHGQRGGSPTVVNLSFLDRSRYFSFK